MTGRSVYYPIETLRDMGIERIMVVLGGRSIGDIVELLADGHDFGVEFHVLATSGAPSVSLMRSV